MFQVDASHMSSAIFTPDEKLILSAKCSIEQPIEGKGEAYLTNKRLLVVQKTGLIKKQETPLVDIRIDQISYVKVEGLISKVLVIGVPHGGSVITYKIKISNPKLWASEIYRLRSQ